MSRDITPPVHDVRKDFGKSIGKRAPLTHDLRHGQEDAHAIDREAGMCKECIERDTEGFAAADDAESVEGDDKECLGVALETTGQTSEDGEDEAADDLEWHLYDGIGEEECFNSVHAVVVIAVENWCGQQPILGLPKCFKGQHTISLAWIDCNVLKHCLSVITCVALRRLG